MHIRRPRDPVAQALGPTYDEWQAELAEIEEATGHAWASVIAARTAGDHTRAHSLMARVDDLLTEWNRVHHRR